MAKTKGTERTEGTTKTQRATAPARWIFCSAVVAATAGCGVDDGGAAGIDAVDDAEQEDALVVATGSLLQPREEHAAAVLADGRVLLVGGNTTVGGSATATTEVFQPASGTFTAGPSLTRALQRPAAVTLSDGRVLVVGSLEAQPELLGPTFAPPTTTPPPPPPPPAALPQPLLYPTLSLLSGGDVLAVGARVSQGLQMTAYRYRPSTNVWTSLPAVPLTTDRHGATVLLDGRVFVASGGSAALFQPSTNTWSAAAPLPSWRDRPRLVTLQSGRVAVFGTSCGASNERELAAYDPVANTWSVLGTLQSAHNEGAGLMLADNRTLLIAGGDGCPGPQSTSTVELFDTQLLFFTTSDFLTEARTTLTASRLLDGRVLLAGGRAGGWPQSSVSRRAELRVTPGPVTATYNATLRTPACAYPWTACAAPSSLLNGRGTVGNEPNRPNTVGGTCVDGNVGVYHADESLDAVRVVSVDGGVAGPGRQVRVEADVWAWTGFTSDRLDVFVAPDANNPVWTLLTTRTPTRAGAQTISHTFALPTNAGWNAAVRVQFRYGGSAVACQAGSYNDRDDVVLGVAPPPPVF